MRAFVRTLILAAASLPSMALAAPDPAETMARLRADFILPRYEKLASETGRLSRDVSAFCKAPKSAGFKQAVADFHAAADAWAAVEVIRFGPISDDLAYDRMEHFPERKNAVTRSLSALLESNNPADLTPEGFRDQSVAVQGFSALERLFFDKDAERLLSAGAAAPRRCAVAMAISASLANRSETVRAAWVAGGYKPDEAKEMLARAVTDLITLYKQVLEQKILPVVGDGPAAVKPMAGEMWRAGRVERNLAINVASAADMTHVLIGEPDEDTRSVLATAQSAHDIAASMPQTLAKLAADARRRSRIVLLQSALHSAQETATSILPPALGITVGFNSLDGD